MVDVGGEFRSVSSTRRDVLGVVAVRSVDWAGDNGLERSAGPSTVAYRGSQGRRWIDPAYPDDRYGIEHQWRAVPGIEYQWCKLVARRRAGAFRYVEQHLGLLAIPLHLCAVVV